MARVQLIIPDEDRIRFADQARKEGMTFSAWLRAAANDRLARRKHSGIFESKESLEAFFRKCDEIPGPEHEPDWEETKKLLTQVRPSVADGL